MTKHQTSPLGDIHNQKPHINLMQSIQVALQHTKEPKPHKTKSSGLSFS